MKQKASNLKNEDLPRLLLMFKNDNSGKSKKEINLEKEMKGFNKKY